MTHDFKRFPELTNSQMQFYYFESPHKQITENFFAKVVKVVDGDTINLRVDFRDFDFPLRLLYINAPEINEEKGKEVKNWLENELLNEDVEVLLSRNRVEKWGRLLGRVIHNGFDIGELEIVNGLAKNFGQLSFEEEINKRKFEKWL